MVFYLKKLEFYIISIKLVFNPVPIVCSGQFPIEYCCFGPKCWVYLVRHQTNIIRDETGNIWGKRGR